jgi:hypothetical protein
MAGAARRLLDALPQERRARCRQEFDGPARMDWHFVPRTRPGVQLGETSDAQRIAARDLLRSVLSSQGALKAEAIMALDGVLRDTERAAGGDGKTRDPMAYTISVYGTPRAGETWGWKIEGHHLSLNFTVVNDEVAGATPFFMGAHPARVDAGPEAGRRALAAEEDLAYDLLATLDDAQRAVAVIAERAPGDILTQPGRGLDGAPAAGLEVAKMRPEQRGIVEALLDEYAHNLRGELASAELDRIHKAGMDAIRFAWAGSAERTRGHYYRLAGPTFVIEFDNTQDGANHIHAVWRDLANDWGADLLARHYATEHRTGSQTADPA